MKEIEKESRNFFVMPKEKEAKILYNAYKQKLKDFSYTGWNKVSYNEKTRMMNNFNPFSKGIINNLLKDSEFRVPVLKDNAENGVYNLIRGSHYSDFNSIAVYKKQPFFEKNRGLWEKIIELAEEKQGKVKFPFLVQGFYMTPNMNEREQGVKITPASNFEIVEDKRLLGRYNGKKFDDLDEKGLPLFDKKGKFTFYSGEDMRGLSRVLLDWEGSLHTCHEDLVGSNSYSGLILTRDKKRKGK